MGCGGGGGGGGGEGEVDSEVGSSGLNKCKRVSTFLFATRKLLIT